MGGAHAAQGAAVKPAQAECLARAATAAAAKDQDERAARSEGDPFTSARWSKARGRFLGAVDEVTLWVRDRETQIPNTPGRETAERRLVEAAAGLLRVAGRATCAGLLAKLEETERDRGTPRAELRAVARSEHEEIKALREEADGLRIRLAGAEAATEQARAERDAAERDRGVLRSRIDRLARESIAWAEATGEPAPTEAGNAVAALRSRVADLEAKITSWQAATGCDHPERVGLARVDAGRTWVERTEARLVALERETASLRYRLDQQTPTLEWALYTNRKIEALERRTAAMPDALSEACREIAAGLRTHAPDPTPPAAEQAAQDAAVRGTLPRMPEQTGIATPPVPHITAEEMQAAIIKMLREQAELAGKYSAADAADAIEAGKHLAFLEPPVPHVTAEQERAAIVAWLKQCAAGWSAGMAAQMNAYADRIERGDHHRADPDPGF